MSEYGNEVKESIFLKQRRERLNKIQNFMKGEKEITLKKLIAKVVMITGLSPQKAREYIQTLIDAEYLKIEDGIVKLNNTHTDT